MSILSSEECRQLLKQAIAEKGTAVPPDIVKVGLFLNHKLNMEVVDAVGLYLARKFQEQKPTVVLTIETSGIPIACAVARELWCDVIYARKSKSLTLQDAYATKVRSYTKGTESTVLIDKSLLTNTDRVLIIDDFLAHGNAAVGLVELVRQAGAMTIGVGVAIEKYFQYGRVSLSDIGINNVQSVVAIESISACGITYMDI